MTLLRGWLIMIIVIVSFVQCYVQRLRAWDVSGDGGCCNDSATFSLWFDGLQYSSDDVLYHWCCWWYHSGSVFFYLSLYYSHYRQPVCVSSSLETLLIAVFVTYLSSAENRWWSTCSRWETCKTLWWHSEIQDCWLNVVGSNWDVASKLTLKIVLNKLMSVV